MSRALSPTEILKMKKESFKLSPAWAAAFGSPEKVGVWFIWGNSGNGKTGFVMQLGAELSRDEKVLYVSYEEGFSLTMQNNIRRYNLTKANKRFQIVEGIPLEELSERLSKPRSPKIVIIDSFQYTQMTYKSYLKFKEAHRDKLIIFVSHADGNNPSGRSAKSVMYDATLKIWVQGYRAFSKGRFFGSQEYFSIWGEGARKYWGE